MDSCLIHNDTISFYNSFLNNDLYYLNISYAICIATQVSLMQKQLNATSVLSYSKNYYCKCIWPPKWVLMIMTCTIKKLIHVLNYEQDLKSLKLKRASIDAKFAKGTVHELHWGVSLISILNLSIGSTVLLRETRNYGMEMQ